MVSVPVQCPYCQTTAVIKAGTQANGTQRYLCQNEQGTRRIFLLQIRIAAAYLRSASLSSIKRMECPAILRLTLSSFLSEGRGRQKRESLPRTSLPSGTS